MFKHIKKDSVLPELYHMDWDVIISGRPYFVVKIDGYVHTIGGRYGHNDLWAYPRTEEPTYETLIPFDCDEPVSWGISYTEHNRHEYQNMSCTVGCTTITRNGKPFCDVPCKDMYFGIDKARVMIAEFHEHPLNLDTINFDKKMIGRKVWWRSEPAVISRYIENQACVVLTPDGINGFSNPAEYEHDGYYLIYEDEGVVKADILDRHICWFREERIKQ